MTRFVVGDDRSQSTLFPERLDDYLSEDNPVRAIDVFVDELDLAKLGFDGVEPEVTGRPAEDDAAVQGLVEDTLTEGGFEPAIAASGEEAVTLLKGRTANNRDPLLP